MTVESSDSAANAIVIVGKGSTHRHAVRFAETVRRVHHRYATEVVGKFDLCPFMNNPDTAFGTFCVVLDTELDVDLAAKCVLEATSQVSHIVYPMTDATPSTFEKFGNKLHQAVAKRSKNGPVHATFHPQMGGDASKAARLVGVLRRSPDPFVQFVPVGLHEGGSQFIDLQNVDLATFVKTYNETGPVDHAKGNFEKIDAAALATITATISDIHKDRNQSYAEFVDALGAA